MGHLLTSEANKTQLNQGSKVEKLCVTVILLQIVKVSRGAHFVKNRESQGLEPMSPS